MEIYNFGSIIKDNCVKIRNALRTERQTIPIAVMTANAFVKDVRDAPDAGRNAHIAKPINMENSKNTLGSCIRR